MVAQGLNVVIIINLIIIDHSRMIHAFRFIEISKYDDGGELMPATNLCLEAVRWCRLYRKIQKKKYPAPYIPLYGLSLSYIPSYMHVHPGYRENMHIYIYIYNINVANRANLFHSKSGMLKIFN